MNKESGTTSRWPGVAQALPYCYNTVTLPLYCRCITVALPLILLALGLPLHCRRVPLLSVTPQALILMALWLSGFPLTNLLPRFLLGGVLMNLGALMLVEWAWVVPRLRMQPTTHALVIGMAFYSLYASLLGLVFAGLLGESFVLVYRFSRLPVVKYHVSMRSLTSVRRRAIRWLLLH